MNSDDEEIIDFEDFPGSGEDNPWGVPEEEPEPEPTGLESQHVESLELVDSSSIHAAPLVWLMGSFALLILIAAAVLAAGAWADEAHRYSFAAAAIFCLIIGAVIAATTLASRKRFRKACETAVFDIRREVGPDKVAYEGFVQVTLDTTNCDLPSALKVRFKERAPPGFEMGRNVFLDGLEIRTFKARAQMRGKQAFRHVDVLMKDKGGLWRHTRTYGLDSWVEVDVGMTALQLRNMLNSRTAFPDGAPKALVNLFRDIEHEQLRTYQGGDRMKDVDWKRMSMTGTMMVKDRIVESLNVGLLLIDAGTSMRLVENGRRNLDAALEAAAEIFQEGGRLNHQLGFLAFDDGGLIEEMPPTRARMLYHDAMERFQKVASRVGHEHNGTDPLQVSMQRALRRMAGSKMGVLLFSDLETIDEGVIQALARLGGDGAKVGVILLPQPSVAAKKRAYRRDRTRPASGAYRGKMHRRELREVLSVQGIETMELPV